MNHIKTDDCNMVYRGPEPGIGDLHCRRSVIDGRGRTAIFSIWTFTDEERKAIAEGANVELAIYHYEPIPPVSMLVTTKGADACAPKMARPSWRDETGEFDRMTAYRNEKTIGIQTNDARYRWLRSEAVNTEPRYYPFWQEFTTKLCREEKMDAVIDAAMADAVPSEERSRG